jgi:AraC-like DNA-binding protein
MTGWTGYVSITIAVIGLVQAVFLCLILRSEGARAFGANRWMMIFIFAIACNLIEDVFEQFVPAGMRGVVDLFFGPINFVIAPAIYLYFREISGNPSHRPFVHALLPILIFNLIAWVVTHDNGQALLWPGGYRMGQVVEAFVWTAIFVQIAIYMTLLWRIACEYFKQTQEQLGADRNVMRRWLGVILGGLSLVFITVAVGRIISLFSPEDTEMFGTEIAFVVVLFAMSYEIATKPALFVMPNWPSVNDIDEGADTETPANAPYAEPSTDTTPETDRNAGQTGIVNKTPTVQQALAVQSTAPVRALLDEAGVERAIAQLNATQERGDILLDPLVSLPKLARAVGVTPNQLSYVLNQHLGQSFFDFVNRARIAEARAVLVLEPDRTILDIALSVGFNSKSTFNLAFKKITDETPSAVREAAKQAQSEVIENADATATDGASERPDAQHQTPKAVI